MLEGRLGCADCRDLRRNYARSVTQIFRVVNARFDSIRERISALIRAQDMRDRVLNLMEQHRRWHIHHQYSIAITPAVSDTHKRQGAKLRAPGTRVASIKEPVETPCESTTEHRILWNAETQEWCCVQCFRTSDHRCERDAAVELSQFECASPHDREVL